MEGCEGWQRIKPSLSSEGWVFYWYAMGCPIWDGMKNWNLKIFLSFSLGIHLLFFSVVSILFPDFKTRVLPPLKLEVSLLPVIAKEKTPRKMISSPIMKTQIKEEEKNTPEQEKKEEFIHNKESGPEKPIRVETETRLTVPTIDPPVLSSHGEEKRILIASEGLFSSKISLSRESEKATQYPSPPDEEVVFARPKYAENPKPFYPSDAKKKGYQGEVVLKVEVLSNGGVGQIEVKKSSGFEMLDRSALGTVRQWRFIPAHNGNGSISCWVNIPIKFQLQ